jgi:serine/threonine-protein kinase
MKFCPACKRNFDDASAFCPTDGEVLQESPETFVGQVLEGKYKIEGFIAQGGMGAVYRARHILLGDQVVIKTLRSEMRNNSEWLRRFQREGKAARAFRHPNSVTVYDLSTGTDGLIYMVMEYVEGHTLDEELKRRVRFTPAEAIEVLAPVADVLDAAHARGVVHRDLKPENIMLGKSDAGQTIVKVLDLGIAKMVGAGEVHSAEVTSLTIAGQILGTPYYMSPEQWGELPRDGKPEVDGRTDIYSLGVIFFELVAGKKPLGGRTLSELRQKHVAAPLPSLVDVVPEVPEAFSRAVARAMAKDRDDRPQRASELIAELRAALDLSSQAHTGGRLPLGQSEPANRTSAGADGQTTHPSPAYATDPLEQSRAATLLTSDEVLAPQSSPPTSSETSGPRPNTRTSLRDGRGTSAADASGFDSATAADARRRTLDLGTAAETRIDHTDAAIRQTRIAQPSNGSDAAFDAQPRHAASRSLVPLLAGGALVLLLVVGAVGWLALRGVATNANVGNASPPATVNAAAPVAPPATAAPPKVEAVSYWFETFDDKDAETGAIVAEPAPTLASGKFFTLHFRSPERGYLYIVGPGEGNALMTLLTAKGTQGSRSNLVGANADFEFPVGGVKLKLDELAGAEDFTVIFSTTPLLAPKFLAEEFGHTLSPAEVRELEDLRAQAAAGAATHETKDEGGARRVAVNVARDASGGARPLIFEVRVNHK